MKELRARLLPALLALVVTGCSAAPNKTTHLKPVESPAVAPAMQLVNPVAAGLSKDGIAKLCESNLDVASRQLAALKALDPDQPDTLSWANTMEVIDNLLLSLENASNFPYLMGVAHPDETLREAARKCESKTERLTTALYLDAELARLVKAYADKRESLQPSQRRFVEQVQRDMRRSGVTLPAGKRARLKALNKKLTRLSQAFMAQIGASRGYIEIPHEHLAGLSDSFKAAHPPNEHGMATITTDYPDYLPFVKHARERNAAQELYIKFVNRGGQVNVERLGKILALRHEKAQLLGYATWADYALEPRMAKTAAGVHAFIERVSQAIGPAVQQEHQRFEAHWDKLGLGHRVMTPADRYFLEEKLKQAEHGLDSNELAQYFEFDRVTAGLLRIASKLYGLDFTPLKEPSWHPSVRVYEVTSGGEPAGKLYLDMFPRENKYKHAAMFPIRTAKVLPGGKQTPMVALVCNFVGPGEPMPHDQVVTYFHELGHVLHYLLAAPALSSFAGIKTVRDFDETPSQVFEEWAWDKQVLDLFARHKDSGKKLPAELFDKMVAARRVGRALHTERQLYLASLDMAYHTASAVADTTELLRKVHTERFSFSYVQGTHFQSSFSHLIGYDAGYYSYQWSLVLTHEVLGRFKAEGLLNPEVAAEWRDKVLVPGASRDERSLVADFIGHEPTERPYIRFLTGS